MAKIQNTLTRLHKIAGRINQKRQQLADSIAQGTEPKSLDAAVVSVRGAELAAKTARILQEDLAKHDALLKAYEVIRNALAKANVEVGVTALLAEQDSVSRRIGLLKSILDSQQGAVSLSDANAIFAARVTEQAPSMSPRRLDTLDVGLVDATQHAKLVAELDAAERALVRLGDTLADRNATQITVELSDDIAAEVLGLAA